MATLVRRIPTHEWETHREKILALYQPGPGNTLDELVKMMSEQHGFSASLSQFESRLRLWGARKNLRTREWKPVIEILDYLKHQGMKTRVLVSGHQINEARVNRARRHCSRIIEVNLTAEDIANYHISKQVSIEIQQPNGQWTLWNNIDGTVQNSTSIRSNQEPDDSVMLVRSFDRVQANSGESSNNSRPSLVALITRGIDNDCPLQLNSTPIGNSNAVLQASPFRTSSPGLFDVPTLCFYELPFKQLENNLKSCSDVLKNGLNIQGLRTLEHFNYTSSGDGLANDSSSRSAISTLSSLIPGEQNFLNDPRKDSQLLSKEEASGTIAIRALIFSIMNGFVGLDSSITQEFVQSLLCLNSVTTSLLHALKMAPVQPAMAFAETLFTAAIENMNQSIVKEVLRTELVDVNQVVCFYEGRRGTAIERSISLGDLDMVLLLLSAGANLERFSRKAWAPKDALLEFLRLLEYPQYQSRVGEHFKSFEVEETDLPDPSYSMVIDKILQVSNEVIDQEHIREVLSGGWNRDVVHHLFSKLSPADHSYYYAYNDYLRGIIHTLDDDGATTIINQLFLACNHPQCGTCQQVYREDLEEALIEGAIHGMFKFVNYLLDHINPSAILSRILVASIRGGNDDLITLVLSKRPNLDPPAAYISESVFYTTPLAEAIHSSNGALISLCEAAGALEHLDEGGRFHPAINMASKVGNIAYTKKLLLSHPNLLSEDLVLALCHAIGNDHRDIASALFDAGATFLYQGTKMKSILMHPRGNLEFLHKQLNANPTGISIDVIRSACMMNDERFIQDIIAAEPDPISYPQDDFFFQRSNAMSCTRALNCGNPYFFKLLSECRLVTKTDLAACLAAVIKVGETGWVSYLISIGADPRDASVLQDAAKYNPGLLDYLLREPECRQSSKIKYLGSGAVIQAIMDGFNGSAALEILLAREEVDKTSFAVPPGVTDQRFFDLMKKIPGVHCTPLGLAIFMGGENAMSGYAMVKRLLDSGCDPNSIVSKTYVGVLIIETALNFSIKCGNSDVVKLLVEREANINREAKFTLKRTPLQIAAELGDFEMVKYLLDCGADANGAAAVSSGATALQFAAISGNINVVAELLRRGAQLDAPPSKIQGRWPIEGAAEHSRIDMIDYLWKYSLVGSPVRFPEKQCLRAMELAEKNGHMACRNLIQELMDNSSVPADPARWGLN